MFSFCKTLSLRSFIFSGLLATAAWPLSAEAITRYVDPNGVNNILNFCGDPNDPCQTIDRAVTVAVAGDVIELSNGIFAGPRNRGLTINQDLTIRGQGVGLTTIGAGYADRHFTIGAVVTIENLTLTRGNPAANGGSIQVNAGSLTIVDSELIDNTSPAQGGAIYAGPGTDLIVRRSTFTENGGGSSSGGAISCDTCASLTVTNCVFDTNITSVHGGAINSEAGNVFIGSTELVNNWAHDGGAIYHQNNLVGGLVIEKSTLSDNTADSDGGAVFVAGSAVVEQSTFSTNEAAESGGGMYAGGGDLQIVNSTFSDNTALWGGALSVWSNVVFLDVYSSTFYHNTGIFGGTGGAIHSASPSFTLTNSIVAASVGGACLVGGAGVPTGNNNRIDDDYTCSVVAGFNLGAVTNLDSVLQNNGGPTNTHALLAGSNAIDLGFGNCPNPITGGFLLQDQRGFPRPFPFLPLGARCDIGAFELQ